MLKVGLVQTRTPATQSAALAHTAPLIREAAAAGATLVVTPECSNILQRDRTRLFAALTSLDDDAAVGGFRALAAELSIWLLIGSALVLRDDGKAANRSILVGPDGGITATYDKIICSMSICPPASGTANPPPMRLATRRSPPRRPAPCSA